MLPFRPALFLFPAGLLLCISCAEAPVKEKVIDTLIIAGKTYDIHTYTPEAFDHLPSSGPERLVDRNENIQYEDSSKAKRVDKTLVLKTVDGKEVILANTFAGEGMEDYTRYIYVGSMKTIACWYVDVYEYESYHGLLIDQRNGQQTEMWNKPRLSPDLKHFIVANLDLDAAFTPNGFQLWELTDDGPKKIWEREFEGWGPDDVRWVDNNTIAFVKTYHGTDGFDKHEFRKMKLF
ncbi:MAG: hypothetical protein FD123_4362 [Bacteroidetes bacterium]|nr:MAG: hypothetical protein FD123_4362 [Bacteroidota bacterium]